jgi:hypothetical protein
VSWMPLFEMGSNQFVHAIVYRPDAITIWF